MADSSPFDDVQPEDASVDLLLRNLSHSEGQVRERARKELAERGPDVIDDLAPYTRSPNERERWEAAKTLGQIRDPGAARLLAEAMDDDRFDVHWIATEGLIHLGDRSVAPVLHQLVERAHSVRIREGAERVLGEVSRTVDDEDLSELVREVLEALHGFTPVEQIAEKAYETLRKLDT